MRYVIGIDFGTLSARALLMDADSGAEVAEAVFEYPHGVMDRVLPSGVSLPSDFALQHPGDYLDALSYTVRQVTKDISVGEVIGLGIDFTSCTVLPVDREGEPLCFKKKYEDEPHAYVKLWKHHGAQKEAEDITRLASERGEDWLGLYGGRISAEWALPKILETLRQAPSVYADTHRFLEAGDWISLMLTGRETHSPSFAGYKWLWRDGEGFPEGEFFSALDTRMKDILGDKICERVDRGIAGYIDGRGSALTGLPEGTPVALPIIDAHAALPALDITGEGDLMLILGTSGCALLNSAEEKHIKGISGYAKNANFEGLSTYEAGQSSFGDNFDWFVKSCVPAEYVREAESEGVGIHALLRRKAMALRAGQSGLLALDWLGGNRSVLNNHGLKGMILGLDLSTRPEEIYRALIEASVFGSRVILERYAESGIRMGRIIATGGIAQKDELMMQVYADVLDREIYIANATQAAARGSAMRAAVAADVYSDVTAAAGALATPCTKVYKPVRENVEIYADLYCEYKRLHDYFGRGENPIMLKLKKYKEQ